MFQSSGGNKRQGKLLDEPVWNIQQVNRFIGSKSEDVYIYIEMEINLDAFVLNIQNKKSCYIYFSIKNKMLCPQCCVDFFPLNHYYYLDYIKLSYKSRTNGYCDTIW